MKEKILGVNIKHLKNSGVDNDISEMMEWEVKFLNKLSCDELFLIEAKRDLNEEPKEAVKETIILRGCKRT